MPSRTLTAIAIAAALALGACAYRDAIPVHRRARRGAAGGYHETQIEPGRWRVVFGGNSLTSRETVETYLLYRSAELTVQGGYDWFRNVEGRTDTRSETYIYHRPEPALAGGYWGPHWRYHSHGWYGGWHNWDPWSVDPFFDVQTVSSYVASAEIVMGHGAKPQNDPTAFDAHAVLDALGPNIVRPS